MQASATASPSTDILALGEAMIEFNEARASDAHAWLQGFGGDTSNFAIAAARQRASVGYVTRIGDDAFVLLQGQAYPFGVRSVLGAQGADGRESIREKRGNVGLPNGGLRVVPHLRLVDGDAAH